MQGRGTCSVCGERKGIKLDGCLRAHKLKSTDPLGFVTEMECPGSRKKPAPVEQIKDGLTPGLRAALDGIPGPFAWQGYEESRKVYAEIGGCLLSLGLNDGEAAKIMEAAYWAAVKCYSNARGSRF